MTTDARSERTRLAAEVAGMIQAGPDGDPSPFDALALEIFAYQYANNALYREFADSRGVTPESASAWTDIPAFPTGAFKGRLVASFPLQEAVMAQITRGSTSEDPGQIFRDEVGRELVLAANRTMTGHWLFPDLDRGRRCRLLILAPSPQIAPSMGMAIGMEETRKAFGTDDSVFLLGLTGIDIAGLIAALRQAESTGAPVALIGSTSAFVYFFAASKKRGLHFRLPEGSRLCDGGGYRGKFGEMTREGYYEMAEAILGVASHYCVNTLGMAESATNYFDDALRRAVTGSGDDQRADASRPRQKIPPPWARVSAVSVEDLSPLPHGEVGLLRHFDLANLPTVLGLQTDNVGVTYPGGGFEIMGRVKVVDGKVVPLPGERPVGPMGDKAFLRALERYVNFSIEFKMGRATGRRRATETAPSASPEPALDPTAPPCACQELQEELVARTADPPEEESAPKAEHRPARGSPAT